MSKVFRILLVDDDLADFDVFSELLRAQGYEVWGAKTGMEGLRLVREKRPDLVLLDVRLPDIGGIEVCREIKADPDLKDVFVVLHSGEAVSPANMAGGLDTGADDYIVKGVDITTFLARIRATLRLQETTKALRASEEQFRQFAENIRGVFWMTNPEMDQLIYISPAYETIWGRSRQSLYDSPRSWLEAIHPADQQRVRDAIPGKALSGQYDEQYRIEQPDGSLLWVQDRAFPIRDQSGKIYRIAGIAEDITRRKHTEDALRDSQARQGAIMEAAPDGILTFDQAGRVIELNSAMEKMLARTRAFVIGKDICELVIPPASREWFRQGLSVGFTEAAGPILGSQNEMSIIDSDGAELPVECAITRIRLPGQPMFTAFIRDIRERLRTEAQMSMLAHAVESTVEPICITDLQDRFTFTNRAFQKTYGYSETEILGQSPAILFSPNNPLVLMEEILRQSRAGGWRGELLDRRKDGTDFPVFLSTSQIRDDDGNTIGLLGVAQDISGRKQAEGQISLLANAVQSAEVLISITNEENQLTFVNRAFVEASGYSEEELLGKTPHFMYSPRNPADLAERVFRETLAGSWRGEIIGRRKDGSEFPIAVSTSQIKDSQGKLIGLIRVGKDISELKLAERQQMILSQLAYRLSAAVAPREAARVILDIAANLFGWDAGYIDLYSKEDDTMVPVLAVDEVDGHAQVIPPPGKPEAPTELMRLIMADKGRLINRPGQKSLPVKLIPFGDASRPSESMMFVPVRWSGVVLGILSIQSYRKNAYSKEDLKLLQTIADHCGNTIQRIGVSDALRKAEANFRSIFERATEGIFRTAPDGHLLAANPALAEIFGYASPEEFIASVSDVGGELYVNPERRAELKKLLDAHGSVQEFEAANYRKDGSKIWITLNAHVARNAEGKIDYYEGTIQNITERKEAGQRLSDVLELNQTILASSSLGILAYQASGQCVFANEAAARIFNTTVEKLLQQNFRQLDYWRELGLLELAEDTLHTRKIHNQEGRWQRSLGKALWLDCRLASFISGGELHLLNLTDDITDRKEAEEELRRLPQRIIEAQEAERLRVARDLHDSVNQLIAAAKVRLRKVQDTITLSSPATGEILSRCNGLLVQALEENRRVAHNLHPSDLDEFGLVAACRNFCKQFQAQTNINVAFRVVGIIPRLPPTTELNVFRILQEAFNNIENHARAENVRVRLSARGNALDLQIRDDGRGFKQTFPERHRKGRRGMGLANIRERAALVGGASTVESAPGEGTRIMVHIPAGASKQARLEA